MYKNLIVLSKMKDVTSNISSTAGDGALMIKWSLGVVFIAAILGIILSYKKKI